MEVEIDMMECDDSIVNNLKHDESTSGSLNSDMSYHDDDDDEMIDNGDDEDDLDYDGDYMFEIFDSDDDSHYLSIQAQFDNIDLPPGVEASFSWLNNLPTIKSTHKIPVLPSKNTASSSSTEKEDATEEAKKMFEQIKLFDKFKLFDIVDDFSDHHFICAAGFRGGQPPKSWTKKIQDEWKILEKNLPDSIFVRAYETRMDLLRAVIVGPAGTPYHDGLFVFDIHFPPNFPYTPPTVYYYSGDLQLNPNLYECGKVCLSLLNTWTGAGSENWIPNKSTMLQVLVSIQALILNDKPFFNEPGYHSRFIGVTGDQKSKAYNEDVFILSLQTMIYTLKRPPKHFEELVVGHFRSCAHTILAACWAYMEGVEVGASISMLKNEKSGSSQFKAHVGQMVNGLVSSFTRCGATNCDHFRVQN